MASYRKNCSTCHTSRNVKLCSCDLCKNETINQKKAYCSSECQKKDLNHLQMIGFWCGRAGASKGKGSKIYEKGCYGKDSCPRPVTQVNTVHPTVEVPNIDVKHYTFDQTSEGEKKILGRNESNVTVCDTGGIKTEVKLVVEYFEETFVLEAWHGATRFFIAEFVYETGKRILISKDKDSDGDGNTNSPGVHILVIDVPHVHPKIIYSWYYLKGHGEQGKDGLKATAIVL